MRGWRMGDEIGRGAMSVASLVERDGVIGVAKQIRPDQRGNPAFLALLRVEVEALRRVVHPAVIRLLDHGDDWLVLERAHAAPPVDAVALVERVAEALRACHAAGVVHRDPKLENVLWTERGWVLADFGAARIDGWPDPAPALGTPSAMAPERLRGEPASPASDAFALGVLAWTLLTGAPPYPDRWDALLLAHAAPLPPLRPRSPAEEALVERVHRWLDPDPARRGWTVPRSAI